MTNTYTTLMMPVYLIRKHILEPRTFRKKLRLLYSNSLELDKIVSFHEYNKLPAPVESYFRKVLHEGMPYISSVKVVLSGHTKQRLRGAWSPFSGQEYITAIKPGIIRNISTIDYTETETFISGKGDFYKWNYSSFSTLTSEGNSANQSQLLLWLAQCVWCPTSLLPNACLSWEPFSNSCARATFTYRGIKVFFKAWFNTSNELYRLESIRFMPNGKPEKWAVNFSNYQMINAVYVPTEIEASWILNDVEFPYLRCKMESIDYDTPEILMPTHTAVGAGADKKGEVSR